MGMTVSLDDSVPAAQAIGNDITTINFGTPRGVQDITGVNSSAVERLLLLADFSATMNGVFNDAANMSHAVLKTVTSTSVTRTITIVHSGQTLTHEVIVTDYALTRAISGELTWSAPALGNLTTAPAWS